jgi:hypothetical protein
MNKIKSFAMKMFINFCFPFFFILSIEMAHKYGHRGTQAVIQEFEDFILNMTWFFRIVLIVLHVLFYMFLFVIIKSYIA